MNLNWVSSLFKGRFNYRRCRPCLSPVTLRSKGRNNSKHCWPNNVESYCVRLNIAKRLTGFNFFRNNSQQLPSTCNRVCERTQHAALKNVGSCWPTMSRPFARGLMWIVNLSKDVFERRTTTGSLLCSFWSGIFAQTSGKIVSIITEETKKWKNWYSQFILKWKSSHFRLTCVAQKRLCLSSLETALHVQPAHYCFEVQCTATTWNFPMWCLGRTQTQDKFLSFSLLGLGHNH